LLQSVGEGDDVEHSLIASQHAFLKVAIFENTFLRD
jgi:hypothetical protein